MGQASVWAIYGIIVVEEVPYLAIVKNARLVTAPKQTPVYEVKGKIFAYVKSCSL